MPQKTLQLFHGHSLVNRYGGERSAEFVGVYPRQFQTAPQFPKPGFHAADFQTFIRRFERHEQGVVAVFPLFQIVLQMDLGAGVKINHAFLAALAEDHALPFFKIDVFTVKQHQFPHAHSRGCQKIYQGEIPQCFAVVAHGFQSFIRIGFLDGGRGFYLVDTAHRTFQNKVFILQPREEAGKNAADVVDRHAA